MGCYCYRIRSCRPHGHTLHTYIGFIIHCDLIYYELLQFTVGNTIKMGVFLNQLEQNWVEMPQWLVCWSGSFQYKLQSILNNEKVLNNVTCCLLQMVTWASIFHSSWQVYLCRSKCSHTWYIKKWSTAFEKFTTLKSTALSTQSSMSKQLFSNSSVIGITLAMNDIVEYRIMQCH